MKDKLEDLKIEIRNIVKSEFDIQEQKNLKEKRELHEKFERMGIGFICGLTFSFMVSIFVCLANSC